MEKTIIVHDKNSLMEASAAAGSPECFIFDLDGTLVNTIQDLGLACDYLLKEHGIKPKWSMDDYKAFVGNGAKLLVQRAFENKLSAEELESAYARFKVVYDKIKFDHAHVYPEMAEVIHALKQAGKKLVVCTNKPDLSAKGMVFELFGRKVFDVVQGALDSKPKKPDPQVPAEILKALSIQAENAVWIGDSNVDIESAHNLGCLGIGVTWGFRPAQNLLSAGADIIINHPEDILKIFKIDIDNI